MLVLSRKLGEKIFVGDSICITVVDIDRGKIRLGIECPRDIPIYRQELLPIKGEKDANQSNRPAPQSARANGSPASSATLSATRRQVAIKPGRLQEEGGAT